MMDDDGRWKIANDNPPWLKPPRKVYFLTRVVGGERIYLEHSNGKLRTWWTFEKADKVRGQIE